MSKIVKSLKPGQLWRWTFDLSDGSWFLQPVSDEARNSLISRRGIVTIKYNDLFCIISTIDSGPFQYYDPARERKPQLEWCIVMIKDTLCWMDVSFFTAKDHRSSVVQLISDV